MSKKKIIFIGLAGFFTLIFLMLPRFLQVQKLEQTNIFEEIYAAEISYLTSTSASTPLKKIKGLDLNIDKTNSDYKMGIITAFYKNDSLPQKSTLEISAVKGELTLGLYIFLDEKTSLNLFYNYDSEQKTLTKTYDISEEGVVLPQSQFGPYREKYQLTDDKINQYFSLIDSSFLKDWSDASDSSYSEKDYGNVKIQEDLK